LGYYDHFAKQSTTPIGDWIKRRARQRQLALIHSLLPSSNCAILEVGPGLGELTDLFLQAGYHNYSVVEPNTIMRERLAQRGIRTKDYMLPHLDEEDNAYDALLLFHVFEHLNDTHEALVFVSEARRVLQPAGLLCILSPDFLHWQQDFFNSDFSHSNITTLRRTWQLLYNHGFRVLRHAYFSGWLTDPSASLVSHLVRIGLFFSTGNKLDDKLYKAKTSFLRSFLIVGRKEA
jgi:SAM-dependent methyltransferase